MWHTSRGDRTLGGAEAALVRKAIETMIDALLIHVDDDIDDGGVGDCDSGIGVYDALTVSQRIALLHDVASHLLMDTAGTPPLSAALEATVAALFVEVRDQVAIEIDFPSLQGSAKYGEPSWRQLVLTAYHAVCLDPEFTAGFDLDENGDGLPDPWSADIHSWEEPIEQLADAILWDRDFEMADSFMDEDPNVSHHRRRLLGIDDDYFTSVSPDPLPGEVYQLVSKTRDIVRAKPR